MNAQHFPVAVIGAGQAGLSVSAMLKDRGIGHVVLEKHRIAHSWRTQRWESFCLVTPNWQCKLPGFPYAGPDPNGFMPRDDIVAYVEAFAASIAAPVRENTAVGKVTRATDKKFHLHTSAGDVTADSVVFAVSAYHLPNIPRDSASIDARIVQIHSSAYRHPGQLPPGAVLVVGSGQSGCQIAEDLHLAGRQVHLAVGSAPRCPRVYRGRDAVDWLSDLGHYDLPVDRHPLGEKIRRKANHYLTGRDGGRDIDLRKFATEGMVLHGRLDSMAGDHAKFQNNLAANLNSADATYNSICTTIDAHIAAQGIDAPAGAHYRPVWQPGEQAADLDMAAAGISAIIWATGFRSDWSWVDLPLCDSTGYPLHERGVTSIDGVYVVGLPWLYTWGSGRFVGIARDAAHIATHIAAYLGARATGTPKEPAHASLHNEI